MNKKNITKTISVLAISALLSTTSYAQSATSSSGVLAVGANIGTAGFGIEGRSPLAASLYGRLGVNYLHYNNSADQDNLHYKVKFTLLTVPLMLDYHPFDNSGFRISAGAAYNGNQVTATAKPNQNIVLFKHTYTPDQLGSVKAKLTLGRKIAPIASIGYDNSFISDSAWSFNAEAGVMFAGKPKLKLSATGLAAQQDQMLKDLKLNADKSLDDAKKYLKLFPVLSIGVKYKL